MAANGTFDSGSRGILNAGKLGGLGPGWVAPDAVLVAAPALHPRTRHAAAPTKGPGAPRRYRVPAPALDVHLKFSHQSFLQTHLSVLLLHLPRAGEELGDGGVVGEGGGLLGELLDAALGDSGEGGEAIQGRRLRHLLRHPALPLRPGHRVQAARAQRPALLLSDW